MTEVHDTTDRSRTSVPAFSDHQPRASHDAVTAMLTASSPAFDAGASGGLLDLIDQWRTANSEYEAAAAVADGLSEVGLPAPPESLFWREDDWTLDLRSLVTERADGRLWFFPVPDPGQSTHSLRLKQTKLGYGPPSAGSELEGRCKTVTHVLLWPERQARADEIVSAFDAWRAEVAAAHVASGYASALKEAHRLSALACDLEEKIGELAVETRIELAGILEIAKHNKNFGQCESEILTALIKSLDSFCVPVTADMISEDPIFQAITESRTLQAAKDACYCGHLPDDAPEWAPYHEAYGAWANHLDGVLLKTVPTSAMGCVALAQFAIDFCAQEGIPLSNAVTDKGVDNLQPLRLIAQSPLRTGGQEPRASSGNPDPILVAIEAHATTARAVDDAYAAFDAAETKEDDERAEAAAAEADRVEMEAWTAMLRTRPTTITGISRLILHIAGSAREHADRGGPTLSEVFSAINAAVLRVPPADDDEPATIEQAAAHDFEAYSFDDPIKSPADWAARLGESGLAMHVADKVLRMSKADAVAFAAGADGREPAPIEALYNLTTAAKESLQGWASLLGLVEARLLVAASAAALQSAEPDPAEAAPETTGAIGVTKPDYGHVPASPDAHPHAYGLRVDENGAGLRAPPGSTVIVEPVRPTRDGLAVLYRTGRGPEIWDLTRDYAPHLLDEASEVEEPPTLPVCDPTTGRAGRLDMRGVEKVHRVQGVYLPADLMEKSGPLPIVLPEFADPPEGMGLHRAEDAACYPVVRAGETVVFDPTQRDLVPGALCVLEWRSGRRSVLATNQRAHSAAEGAWWVDPINRPVSYEALMARGGVQGQIPILYGSDGPYDADHLASKIVGRVVGILAQDRSAGDLA